MLVLIATFFIEFEIPYATTIVFLVFIIPLLAVSVRRMHDVKRSGWWVGASFFLSLLNYFLTYYYLPGNETLADYDWGILILATQLLISAIVFVFTLKKGVS